MEVTWSECLDLYNKLQTDITGTTEEIEKIVFLDFKDFVESFKSCKTIKDDEEIAVKTVLERKRHLKRCSIDPSRMSDASDHWKILRKVFENVTVEELYVEGTKLNPSCMSHLATLCNVCKVKGLKLKCCDQENDILDISGNKLTPDCMVHLASIWKFCQVKSLKLGMCGIGPKHMRKFATNARNIVIEELDIGCNELTPNCMIDLARICEDCQVKSLKLGYSSLEPEHLQQFAENVVIAKIDELDVSRNRLSSDCMIHLAKITEQCQVKSLKLSSCELGLEHLKKLAENAKNAKIYELDVFENKFTVECMVHLTKICEKFQVKSLKLGWLGLESEHLAKFAEDAKDVKIERLDVSRNKLPPDCMNELARICKVRQVKSLKLGCCDLESVHLKRFAQDAKVDELDISMNNDVFKTNLFSRLFAWLKGSKDAVFHLAKLCEICEVKKLRMRLCGLTSDHLIKFIEFAKSTKILELDIEGNLDISKESKAELQKFLEINNAKAEAEVDSTAKVVEIQVTNSSQEKYESHLNDTRTYSIDKQRMKGKVLIINNEFSGSSAKHRKGSLIDLTNQEDLWRALGFNVLTKKDLSAADMTNTCRKFASDVGNVSAVIVIIMTHGGEVRGEEYLEGEDGGSVDRHTIIAFFNADNAQHLQEVPKVFFFQACRGRRRDSVLATDATGTVSRYPKMSDMIIVHPSQIGHVSIRNETEGSWLMNAVANVFMRNAHDTHLLDMLTMVNDAVARKESEFGDVQMCNQESYLRKKLFLFPGWPL